ncbi:MAG: hypothetical protein RL547_1977 [Actinomycetota bacterium]
MSRTLSPAFDGASSSSVWSQAESGSSASISPAPDRCDVAIVGGGLSGLWLAYWLNRRRPELQVLILEAERVGFGASGRNGGWLSALLPVSLTSLSKMIGIDDTIRMQTIMFEAVRDVGSICATEGIQCDYALGGTLSFVRTEAQHERALRDLADYADFGFAEHARMLDEARTRERVSQTCESVFRPDCATIHPRRLVDGLATVLRERGVTIVEKCRVRRFESGLVSTDAGDVRCQYVIDCREAYGARASRRRVVPIHSLMIATEPLDETTWSRIGLAGRETFTDHRHLLIYGQRTADGRIAFGGRGVGYHYGSRVDPSHDLHAGVHGDLRDSLVELFPDLADSRITHRWGGALAAPRDWTWTVVLDPISRVGHLGGYTGDGVTSTFVAARAMAEVISDGTTDLPLFGHRSRRWEPEPFRWIGVNAMNLLAGLVDRKEAQGGHSRFLGYVLDRLL